MTKSRGRSQQVKSGTIDAPCLDITKLGIVSRDYRHIYENGFRDFSHVLPGVLNLLDGRGCDSVLFSLYSIAKRESYSPILSFNGFQNIKAVLLEEFQDEEPKENLVATSFINRQSKDGESTNFTKNSPP